MYVSLYIRNLILIVTKQFYNENGVKKNRQRCIFHNYCVKRVNPNFLLKARISEVEVDILAPVDR